MASKELRVLALVLCLFLGLKIEVRAQEGNAGKIRRPDSNATYGVWEANVTDPKREILMSDNGNFSFNLLSTNQSRSSCAAVLYQNAWKITTWVGNFNTTIVDSNTNPNCFLNFSGSAGLVLSSGSNGNIWSTEPVLTKQKELTGLYLNDDGCLYIAPGRDNGHRLWDSCHYPSDTLVKFHGEGNHNFEMSAALSNYEYSSGKDFSMRTNESRDLTLSQTISYNGSFIDSPYLTIRDWPNKLKSLIYDRDWDYVRLQPNGGLVFKKSSNETIHSLFNDSSCESPGTCGAFGICSGMGSCSCPESFKPSNQTSGFGFTCEGPAGSSSSCEDQLVNVTGRTYLDAGSFITTDDITVENCRSRCIDQCCTNALHLIRTVSSSTEDVSSKTGPCLLNLTSVLTIQDVSDPHLRTQTLFLRVPSLPAPTSSTKSSRRKAAIGFAVGAGALLLLLLCGSTLWLFLKRRKLNDDDVDTGKPAPPHEPAKLPQQYSYKELEESTGNFNRRLGYGWSSVYAGQSKTAIKRLDDNIEEKAFLAAVATMASLSHPNLVPLRGFCSEGRHKMLVYELVDDGQSLNCYLFRKDSSLLMHVQQRRMIALETARGLAYLHASHIIHGGVKPENIMIDSDENIRLVDYGLMSLTPNSHKLTTATKRGCRAYMAPEWSKPVPVTPKVDVYSFGVVLLELVSGRSCWTQSGVSEEKRFLPSWASAVLASGPDRLLEIADPRLDAQALIDDDKQVLRGMIFVALWCVQEDPSNRYPMSHVVGMLNGDVVVYRPPSPGLDALATELYAIHGNNEPRTDSHR